MKQEQIVSDDTGLESQYIKLQNDKRIYLTITNWNTWKTTKIWDGTEKESIVWRADVLKYGESPLVMNVCLQPKVFEQSSKTFRNVINEKLAGKDRKQSYLLGIKRTGTKENPIFDIEIL
jgi:hypothetical protein